MKRILILSFLFAGLLGPSSVSAFDLDSLLVESVGGKVGAEKLKSLTSWEMRGRAKFGGMTGTFVRCFVRPDKYYMKITLPELNLEQAFDGETAWQTDLNGRVSELKGYLRDEMIQDIYMLSFDYLFSDSLEKMASYLGIKEINGKVYHEVAFFPFGSDTVLTYYDTATGLESYSVAGIDQLASHMYQGDYRSVSGLLIPYHMRNEVPATNFEAEFFTASVKLDAEIDMTIFAAPENVLSDYLFPPDSDKVTLEVSYYNGHISIPVVVNGQKKLMMFLDTGASSNVLNLSAVSDLELPRVGTMSALGVGGAEEMVLVQTDSIQIGALTLYNQVAAAMDLDAAFQPSGSGRFGGLLGQDFWSRFPVLVDYYYSKITVFNPDKFTPPPGGVEVPFHLSMLVPTIRGEVEGVEGDFIVDLGNASGLLLNKHFVDDNNLESTLSLSLYSKRAFGGIGGMVIGRNAYTSIFKMGDVELKSLLVFIPDTAVGMMGSEAVAGNIGNRVLEKFRVLFDYHRCRMIFYRY